MRNNRLLAVAGVGMMAVVGCSLCNCNRKNTGAEKSGPAELPKELIEKPVPAELPKELIIDLGGGVKIEFVLIHPGSFTMGPDMPTRAVHKVTLTKPFYLGKYEVTQEQWENVMGSNPSNFKGAKNPVEQVSWDDCQGFLTKLKEKVSGHAFRLPTDAEWEYACRAGSTGDRGAGRACAFSAHTPPLRSARPREVANPAQALRGNARRSEGFALLARARLQTPPASGRKGK